MKFNFDFIKKNLFLKLLISISFSLFSIDFLFLKYNLTWDTIGILILVLIWYSVKFLPQKEIKKNVDEIEKIKADLKLANDRINELCISMGMFDRVNK